MILIRIKKTKTSVLGVLKDDVGGTYFTCENAAKLIPSGDFSVDVCDSPRFKTRLPLVYSKSVLVERGVRIHSGNSYQDSEGCILVGNCCDLTRCTLVESKKALEQLLKNCGKVLRIEERYNG